jgi:hypothetical protein
MDLPKTIRLCAGLSHSPPEAPCRPKGRWFHVGPYKNGARRALMAVCEAHLGWAITVSGLPALVTEDPGRGDEDTQVIGLPGE